MASRKRKPRYEPESVWVFAWKRDATGKHGTGFLLSHIAQYSRGDCKRAAEQRLQREWADIAKDGGTCVRCIVKPATPRKGKRNA